VTASVHIDATPEQVYAYFVRADAIARWLGDSAILEATPGGAFSVDVRGAPVRGRFLELAPPHRLVLSWGYQGSRRLPPGASTIEITLTEEGSGTRVLLEHHGLPHDERLGHEIGWGHYLPRLQSAAAGSEPGPDPGMPPVPGG
jgi:uncharacterized protein YndB with AHSA1/START domain